MSENRPTAPGILLVLVALLIAGVGVQTWFMARMHHQIALLHAEEPPGGTKNMMAGPTTADSSGIAPPVSPFDEAWFDRPLDPDTWNPFQEMRQMQDRMNKLFGRSFGRFHQSPLYGDLVDSDEFSPTVDLRDDGDRFVIRVDLPGTKDGDINVSLEGQSLTISGKRERSDEETDKKSGRVIRRERSTGTFSRTITLPDPVDDGAMTTKLEDGVFEISIPKASPEK